MMDVTNNINAQIEVDKIKEKIDFEILKDKYKLFEEELLALKAEIKEKNKQQDEKVNRLEDKVDSQLMKLIDLGHNMTRMEISMTHISNQQIEIADEQKSTNKILLSAVTGEFKRDKAHKRQVHKKWVGWLVGSTGIVAMLAWIFEFVQKFM